MYAPLCDMNGITSTTTAGKIKAFRFHLPKTVSRVNVLERHGFGIRQFISYVFRWEQSPLTVDTGCPSEEPSFDIIETKKLTDFAAQMGAAIQSAAYKPNNVCNAEGKNDSLDSRGTGCDPAASRIGKAGSLTPLWGMHKNQLQLNHTIWSEKRKAPGSKEFVN